MNNNFKTINNNTELMIDGVHLIAEEALSVWSEFSPEVKNSLNHLSELDLITFIYKNYFDYLNK